MSDLWLEESALPPIVCYPLPKSLACARDFYPFNAYRANVYKSIDLSRFYVLILTNKPKVLSLLYGYSRI